MRPVLIGTMTKIHALRCPLYVPSELARGLDQSSSRGSSGGISSPLPFPLQFSIPLYFHIHGCSETTRLRMVNPWRHAWGKARKDLICSWQVP
jgi:hypothetical protein